LIWLIDMINLINLIKIMVDGFDWVTWLIDSLDWSEWSIWLAWLNYLIGLMDRLDWDLVSFLNRFVDCSVCSSIDRLIYYFMDQLNLFVHLGGLCLCSCNTDYISGPLLADTSAYLSYNTSISITLCQTTPHFNLFATFPARVSRPAQWVWSPTSLSRLQKWGRRRRGRSSRRLLRWLWRHSLCVSMTRKMTGPELHCK